MPALRKRQYLDIGARLDVNELVRDGTIDTSGPQYSWLQVTLPTGVQTIALEKLPRSVPSRRRGGHQWYFRCPMTGARAMVLWLPPGQERFCSQQYWRKEQRRFYRSQAMDWCRRAHAGSDRIEARLDRADDYGVCKPKWMHWRTFDRLYARRARYERRLDAKFLGGFARIMRMAE
jgi:hypothetical protein